MKKKMVIFLLIEILCVSMVGCAKDKAVREIYWRVPVEDYEISLQDGVEENTLELFVCKNEQEWSIASYDATNGYRTPEDISVDTFEDLLGHDGFRVYQYFTMGSSLEFCEVDYYGMGEKPIHLAYSWGGWENRNENTYQVDVDEDGINELICNVQWLADGAMDAIIYHWDGEKIYQANGTDLLAQEEDYEIGNVGSVGAEYLSDENKIRTWYWKEELQDFVEKEYEIELEKLEMWEFQ